MHASLGILTLTFFYTMLKTGLALVAVNLPSLSFLFTSISLKKILRSISSKLSLSSQRNINNRSTGDSEANTESSSILAKVQR